MFDSKRGRIPGCSIPPRGWSTWAAWLALALCGSGCAFTDVPITLPTAALSTPVTGGNGRQVVVSSAFEDERGAVQRCGRQINGYGMDTADAICQSDPNAWIAMRLREELRRAGFTVVDEGADSRPGALRLGGSLMRLFVEPKIGAWTGSLEADLEVKLRATSQSGLVSSRTFFVKGWKGGVIVASRQPYLTSLHRATQAIVEEMVRAVIELMDRYPELGANGGISLQLHLQEPEG